RTIDCVTSATLSYCSKTCRSRSYINGLGLRGWLPLFSLRFLFPSLSCTFAHQTTFRSLFGSKYHSPVKRRGPLFRSLPMAVSSHLGRRVPIKCGAVGCGL